MMAMRAFRSRLRQVVVFIVIFPHQIGLLVIVAKVGVVWIIVIFFIPFVPTFPHNTARIGTFPKVAKKPAALIAEFGVHEPHVEAVHPSFLVAYFSRIMAGTSSVFSGLNA